VPLLTQVHHIVLAHITSLRGSSYYCLLVSTALPQLSAAPLSSPFSTRSSHRAAQPESIQTRIVDTQSCRSSGRNSPLVLFVPLAASAPKRGDGPHDFQDLDWMEQAIGGPNLNLKAAQYVVEENIRGSGVYRSDHRLVISSVLV